LFESTKKLTNNFTVFTPAILMDNPQSLMILRLSLGLSHDKFAKELGMNERSLRTHEKGNETVGFHMSMKLIDKIKFAFLQSKVNVTFEEVIKNFRAFKNFLSLDFKAHSRNGLEAARRQNLMKQKLKLRIFC